VSEVALDVAWERRKIGMIRLDKARSQSHATG
jgi:hypothetical protein